MRRYGLVILLFPLSLFIIGVEAAEQYPVKPITCIVPNEAGSDADILARPIMQKASALLGKPIIIVNKVGAASSTGYREVFGAKADGYTIGMGHAALIISKLQGILPIDHRDFTVLGTYATFIPIIVASTKTQRPFGSIQEVISFAKAHPGEVSIATTGVGGSWWVATLAFQDGTGLKFNVIPQMGGGSFSITQVAGGHTDLAVLALAAAKSQIEAGNVRFIAIFGSKKAPGYENVPTLKEIGYNISWSSTQILIAPPKLPQEISEKLVYTFEKAANDPEYKKFVVERTAIPLYLPPDQAVNYFNEQRVVVRGIMEKTGILKEK